MQQPTVCIPHSRHRIPGCVSVTGTAWFPLSEVFCLCPWICLCCQAVDVATILAAQPEITACSAGEKHGRTRPPPPLLVGRHRRMSKRMKASGSARQRVARGSRWRPSTACSACVPLFHLAQQRFSGEPRNRDGGVARSKLCSVTGFLIWSPIEAPVFIHLTSGCALLPDDLFFFSCG